MNTNLIDQIVYLRKQQLRKSRYKTKIKIYYKLVNNNKIKVKDKNFK